MVLPRLLALTPGTLGDADAEDLVARVGAAVAAGLPGLVFREPRLSDRAWLRLFARLRETWPDLWLAGHDRVHLALAVPCEALHLGFRSLAPEHVRPLAEGRRLGLSTHDHDDPATWGAADHLVHGPFRATPSKAGLLEPLGPVGLRRGVERAGRPVFALGGIGPEHVADALAAGAHGVAVLSGLLPGADPAGRTRAYLAALEAG